jgi:hypothetical protein
LNLFVRAVRDGQARAIARDPRTRWARRPLVEGACGMRTARSATPCARPGFALTPETAAALAVEVERLDYTLLIESTINNHGVRQAVAAARDILPGDVTMQMIWNMLRNRDRAEWFLERDARKRGGRAI